MTKYSAEQAKRGVAYVLRIDEQMARLESERAEYVKRCKAIQKEIAAIYRAARDDGHPEDAATVPDSLAARSSSRSGV